MAKKSAYNAVAATARVASGDKKSTDLKSKKQKPTKKSAAPKVQADDENEWEDESDVEMADAPAKSSNKAKKLAAKQQQDEDESSSDFSDDDDSEGGGVGPGDFDLAALDESDSDSEIDEDEEETAENGDQEAEAEEDEEEEIDIEDLSIASEDEEEIAATTRVRQTINNKDALLSSLRRVALDTSSPSVPFAFHQSLVSPTPTADAIPSVDDDLQRELAFMNQALDAARRARALLRKEGVPFTRPTDYFAETVRSDETMEKVKAKMIEDATAKKASAEARKQRDLKKFGKQVQIAKQQERAKQKKEVLDKITLLKKKRKEGASSALGATEADDLFDVAVDNELSSSNKGNNNNNKKRSFSSGGGGDHPNPKRLKKDAKYGFGGKKRHGKSGDAVSSGDLSGFSAKRMKQGGGGGGRPGGGPGGGGGAGGKKFKAVRPGKARRKSAAGKR
ncbi:eukaryotic rRNA processing protein EBP2-domain-containing protein [Echria macrotheca]|uniref:Eukaryotic rRNA processing protein EBP2-domain-containing protein n=1 Tax=Echria macrotheca TaxID=438768 RepID=A0AAJ0FB19_9PEZI|nr:eukaryotic rRNA processing protein EBP2-domain-containing protein [Echria macrotheca]